MIDKYTFKHYIPAFFKESPFSGPKERIYDTNFVLLKHVFKKMNLIFGALFRKTLLRSFS